MAASEAITLELDQANAVLDALLIGLASYGEIERTIDAFETLCSGPLKPAKELRPLHPTGSANTVAEFATAISLLRGAMRQAEV